MQGAGSASVSISDMQYNSVTANLDSSEEQLAVGAKYGYATLDLGTGKTTYIKKVWTEADGPGKEER